MPKTSGHICKLSKHFMQEREEEPLTQGRWEGIWGKEGVGSGNVYMDYIFKSI